MSICAEIAFEFLRIRIAKILELMELSGFISSDADQVLMDGDRVTWSMLSGKIKHNDESRLAIEAADESWCLNLAAIRRHELSLVLVDGNPEITECFCANCSVVQGFLQSRMYDCNYDRLQNATSLSEYDKAGVDTEELELVSNGLPFPLEEKIVDTSKHPGRRVLRDGFIECVGHKMWFSSGLIEKLQIDIDKLSLLCAVETFGDGTKFVFGEAPFHDKSSAAVQKTARELLYRAEGI